MTDSHWIFLLDFISILILFALLIFFVGVLFILWIRYHTSDKDWNVLRYSMRTRHKPPPPKR